MSDFLYDYSRECSFLIGAIQGTLISQENGVLTAKQTTDEIRRLVEETDPKLRALTASRELPEEL